MRPSRFRATASRQGCLSSRQSASAAREVPGRRSEDSLASASSMARHGERRGFPAPAVAPRARPAPPGPRGRWPRPRRLACWSCRAGPRWPARLQSGPRRHAWRRRPPASVSDPEGVAAPGQADFSAGPDLDPDLARAVEEQHLRRPSELFAARGRPRSCSPSPGPRASTTRSMLVLIDRTSQPIGARRHHQHPPGLRLARRDAAARRDSRRARNSVGAGASARAGAARRVDRTGAPSPRRARSPEPIGSLKGIRITIDFTD